MIRRHVDTIGIRPINCMNLTGLLVTAPARQPPRQAAPAGYEYDGADASRRAIGAAYCHPLTVRRCRAGHPAAAADGRPREQARASTRR